MIAVVAFAGTAIAAVAVSRAPQQPARQVVAAFCTAASLHAGLTSATQPDGTRYYLLEFTNTSRATCVLNGYPRVAAYTGIREIGSPAAPDTSVRPKAVTLEPGDTAHARLRYAQAGSFQSGDCRPVIASELRVYPPEEAKPTLVGWHAPVCSRPGRKSLVVQPVEPWTVRHPGSDG